MSEEQRDRFIAALRECACSRCDDWPCTCLSDMGIKERNALTILDDIFALGVASMDEKGRA